MLLLQVKIQEFNLHFIIFRLLYSKHFMFVSDLWHGHVTTTLLMQKQSVERGTNQLKKTKTNHLFKMCLGFLSVTGDKIPHFPLHVTSGRECMGAPLQL